jgi:hypothetical protein
LTMVGGRIVYGNGSFASLAPPAPAVAPNWLPISSFPSYRRADVPGGGATMLAAHTGGGAGLAPHWDGCLCGLI